MGEKFIKVSFITYADTEAFLEKIVTCHSSPEKSSATKIRKHTASVSLLFTHCLFGDTRKTNTIIIEVKTVWKTF